MALRGSIGTNIGAGWRLQIDWSATQNLTNNTSSVTGRMYLMSLGRYYTIRSSSTNPLNLHIGGTNSSGSANPSLRANQKKLIKTFTKTINHNSDGTGNFNIGGWFNINVTLSGTYYGRINIANRNFTLNTIPRRNTFTANMSYNIEEFLPIKINKASSSFRSRVRVYFENTLIEDTGVTNDVDIGFSPSSSQNSLMYSLIPNGKTGELKIVLDTYSGSSVIGTFTRTGVGRTVNLVPLFYNFEYQDTYFRSVNATGNNQILIQNISTVQVKIPYANRAIAQNSATMVEYIITLGDKSAKATYSNSGDITVNFEGDLGYGNTTLSIVAVDSRGYRKMVTKGVQIIEYQKPVIMGVVKRKNNFEALTTIELKGEYSPVVINGVAKNNIRSQGYRYYEEGGTPPSGFTSMSSPSYSGRKFTVATITINLDRSKNFEVDFRVDDILQPDWSYQTVGVKGGVPPIFFEGNGDIHLKGGIITTGNEKTIHNDGSGVTRFQANTGTDAGMRAIKMGDNYTGYNDDTRFPSRTGSWVYFQGAPSGGAGGTDYYADFFLWKDRGTPNDDLYVGHIGNYGGVTEMGKVVTILEEDTYSRGGTTGRYVKYSDGRLIVYWERVFGSSNFVGSTDLKRWITPNIYFMSTAFSSPPVITSNSIVGEIFGYANRQTYNNYFNLVVFASSTLTRAFTIYGVAEGRWD